MNILNLSERPAANANDAALAYATRADFQRIFTEDMGSLHLLALLLTADTAKAEQVFVAGLEESIHGNPVFKDWARCWSKRVIIRNAVKLLAPYAAHTQPCLSRTSDHEASEPEVSEKAAWVASIIQLPAFERFVFVILVLEGHSESDCAGLLGCSMQAMLKARSRALERVAAANQRRA